MLAGVDGGGFSGGGVVTKYFCAWNEMRTCQYSIAEGVGASFELAGVRLTGVIQGQGETNLFGLLCFFDALKFFAGFEAHGFARGNVDLFAGAGIAADAGLARLNAEDAEAAKFDALAAAESLLQ